MNSKSIDKKIVRFAIPNILGNVSVPLLSTLDTWLMGTLSVLHLGAVGLGAMLFDLMYWNFSFLRMGTTGLTAQARGIGSSTKIMSTLIRGLILAIFISVLLMAIQMPFFKLGSWALNISNEHLQIVALYFGIRIFAAPATLSIFTIKGWFFGMHNSDFPLYMTIFTTLINLSLSYYWVIILGWGVEGVAWGTVIAQYCGLGLGIGLWFFKYKSYTQSVDWNKIFIVKEIIQFINLNKDIFIRTFCLLFVFTFLYSHASKMGAIALATNVLILQMMGWMSYAIDGFAYAAESLVGEFYGSKNKANIKIVIKKAFKYGGVIALLFALAYGVGGEYIFSLFTDNQEVISFISPFKWGLAMMPLIGFGCYIWDGIFVGMMAAQSMRNSMLGALITFLVTYYFLNIFTPSFAIWIAFAIFLISRWIIQHILFYKKIFPNS